MIATGSEHGIVREGVPVGLEIWVVGSVIFGGTIAVLVLVLIQD